MTKVHPPELNAEATRLANLAGMAASGQPWQEDAGGFTTAELLAVPHPDLAPNALALTNEEVLKATEANGAHKHTPAHVALDEAVSDTAEESAPTHPKPAKRAKKAPVEKSSRK